jgi:hypothetical protein
MDIDSKNYGMREVTDDTTIYYIDFDGVEKCLSFSYRSDQRKAYSELKSAFPEAEISKFVEETVKTYEDECPLRGDYLIDGSDERHSLMGVPVHNMSDAVTLKVKLVLGYHDVKLTFITTWETDKVARKPAIEKNCVDLPLAKMGKIQAIVENALVSLDYKYEEPVIDCHFDAISESRSECTPDIIQRVRDERKKYDEEE